MIVPHTQSAVTSHAQWPACFLACFLAHHTDTGCMRKCLTKRHPESEFFSLPVEIRTASSLNLTYDLGSEQFGKVRLTSCCDEPGAGAMKASLEGHVLLHGTLPQPKPAFLATCVTWRPRAHWPVPKLPWPATWLSSPVQSSPAWPQSYNRYLPGSRNIGQLWEQNPRAISHLEGQKGRDVWLRVLNPTLKEPGCTLETRSRGGTHWDSEPKPQSPSFKNCS